MKIDNQPEENTSPMVIIGSYSKKDLMGESGSWVHYDRSTVGILGDESQPLLVFL